MEDEKMLIERICSGDKEAFETLVRCYERKIYNLALRMTSSPEDAFDISQEVFLRVWRTIGSFKMESSFSTWLYRIASNICIDFLRRRGRRHEQSIEIQDEDGASRPMEFPDARYAPEQNLDRSQLREAIGQGLMRLSPQHREIVVMRDISGLSYDEIADVLDIEEGTVKSRLSRARAGLRQALASSGNISPFRASNGKEKR